MTAPNVFAVARSVWDDPDFENEAFSEREAWMWLVSSAAWREIRCRGANGGPVALKRGEFSFSVRFLAEKFQWSKSSIDRFLSKLEKRDMLRDTSREAAKVYSIKNYNRFQVVGMPKRDNVEDDARDTSGTEAGHERDKEEAGETVKHKTISPSRRSVVKSSLESDGFEAFYQTFPKHAGRRTAENAYRGALKRATADALLEGARVYAASVVGREVRFIKHPAAWLNGDHWLDDIGTIAGDNVVKIDWAAFNTAEEREAQERLRQSNG